MSRKLAWLAALVPALWLSTAAALGLGEIEVKSKLNQRFTATIPLSSVNMDEADMILVNLASNADFERTGIERTDYLSSLKFALKLDDGAPRIEVTSSQIAREPFVSFLVEVRSPGGRILREYTVLLDPPSLPEPRAAAPAPAPVAPQAAAAPAAPAVAPATPPARSESDFYQTAEEAGRTPTGTAPESPAEAAAAPAAEAPAPAATGASSYGPVAAGETFWSIAQKLRPDATRITMDQMLLALYEGNRGAFDGGINGLRKGSTLQVPSVEQILAVDAATAKSRIAALRGETAARPAPRPAPAAVPPVAVAPPPVTPAPEPAPEPQKKTDELKPAPAPATPVQAPTPEPAPEPATPPAPEPSTAAPTAAPAESEAPQVEPQTPPTETTEPAPSAESTPPSAESAGPVEEPAAAPVRREPEEPGLLSLLIPLLIGLAVLGGLGYGGWQFLKKRREAKEAAPAAPAPKAGVAAAIAAAKAAAAPPPAPAPAREAPKAQEEPFPSLLTEPEPAPAPAKTQQAKTQQLSTQMLSTQQMEGASTAAATSQLPTFDATQVFDSEVQAAQTAIAETGVDFDVTGQFANETVQINLDANDPISEADFHLAYGLYDEAALLLKKAIETDPQRKELRVKLAETYFAAGKPAEFQEAAEALKPMLSSAEWPKIAIMGQQLCPDAAIFKGADSAAVATDLDLAFDEPAVTAGPAAGPSAAPSPPRPAPSGQDASLLDFKLEELELPQIETPAPVAPAAADKGKALEFDLGDFDLNKPTEMPPVEPVAEPAVTPEPARADASVNFDLGVPEAGELRLEDFDIGEMPADSNAIAGGDEASTKLDLARAYVDMGDNEMARNLLNEVLQQGNAEQKKEAQALIGRLS